MDTSKLAIVDLIELSGRDSTYVRVYKFSDADSATNCYKNYKPGENYRIKQYGNLVILVEKEYFSGIVKVINKIA